MRGKSLPIHYNGKQSNAVSPNKKKNARGQELLSAADMFKLMKIMRSSSGTRVLWFYPVPNFDFGYFSDLYEVPDQEVGCLYNSVYEYSKLHLYVEFIVVSFFMAS